MSADLVELSTMLTAPSGAPSREQVERVTEHLAALPQVDMQTRHYRIGNMYAREIRLVAGVALTGGVVKVPHICTISQGAILVTTENGPQTIEAPATIECPGGSARVGLVLDDMVWTAYFSLPEHLANASLADVEAYLVENPETLQTNRLLEAA